MNLVLMPANHSIESFFLSETPLLVYKLNSIEDLADILDMPVLISKFLFKNKVTFSIL